MNIADDDLLPGGKYWFFVPSPDGADGNPAHDSPKLSAVC